VRLIFSVAYWTFLALSSVVMFAVALTVFLATFPFDPNRKVLHLVSCFWAQLSFYVNPLWKLRIEGRERLPWNGAAVLIANHQSLGDILVLFGLYRPFKWVSKRSIFSVPLIGWNMRLNGYVPLVRGDKESIARMMAHCDRWLEKGVPVLLFPEGTRSPDGEVKPFKNGAFTLALKHGCPLIPIVITGTRQTLPKHGAMLDRTANCVVRVLEPLDPKAFQGDVEALRDAARARILEEKARMER
jgi:1-acyl-sn-glycerol-3-phosphate acyltransferase